MKITLSGTDDGNHRKQLEKTGFWGKQAAGCIVLARDTARLLIARRGPQVQEPGTWGTWGGAVDEGERPADAVRRELSEEAGYNGRIKLIPLSVFSHNTGFKYYNFLAVVPKEFIPELDHETAAAKWFNYGSWPRPLHPGLKLVFRNASDLAVIENQISILPKD